MAVSVSPDIHEAYLRTPLIPDAVFTFVSDLKTGLEEYRVSVSSEHEESACFELDWQIERERCGPYNKPPDRTEITVYGSLPSDAEVQFPLHDDIFNAKLAGFSHGQIIARERDLKRLGKLAQNEALGIYYKLAIYDCEPKLTKTQIYHSRNSITGKGNTQRFYELLDRQLASAGFEALFGVNDHSNYQYFVDKLSRYQFSQVNDDLQRRILRLIQFREHDNSMFTTVRIY